MKKSEFRGQQRWPADKSKTKVIEIKTSSAMLAPVDYNVRTITKQFGIKNTIREDPAEPEKFVIIGMRVQPMRLPFIE